MKRVSKIFLLLGGVLGAFFTAFSGALSTLLFGLFDLAGLGVFIGGTVSYSSMEANAQYYDPAQVEEYLANYSIMMGSGIATIIVFTIIGIVYACILAGLLFSSIMALINVVALPDKKAGYIISLILGVLTLISGLMNGLVIAFIGLLIMLGGIFGMIALKKEKKVQEIEVELVK